MRELLDIEYYTIDVCKECGKRVPDWLQVPYCCPSCGHSAKVCWWRKQIIKRTKYPWWTFKETKYRRVNK